MNELELKPVHTVRSNVIFKLPGGTKENDLPVEACISAANGSGITGTILSSTWVLTDEQREQIAKGANIELLIWGENHPPVLLKLTYVELAE